ncbi:MAG: FkbM family methyltransferase [Smithellaceae bacterium]
MVDYKKEISNYLDVVLKRKEFSIDRIKKEIKSSKYVCVFGIGAISYPIISSIKNFTDIKLDFLSDNDQTKWGKTYHDDLKCISPDELEKYADDIAILITTQHYKKIYQQLFKKGFKKIFAVTEYRLLNDGYFKNQENLKKIKKNVLKVMDILEDERSKEIMLTLVRNWFDFDVNAIGYEEIFTNDQYYPAGIIKLSEKEVFVDVGAYNGDTVIDFLKKTKNKFESIFAFELDKKNFKEMESTVDKLDINLKKKIRLYNLGLLDEEKSVYYETGGSGMQSTFINVINTANDSGKTARLSDIIKDEKVTFIKMDIEGSEPQALSGAEEIIKKQKPKLAICVYHKPEHLWEIPLYLKKIVPGYKIYFRHHTPLEYETVCYAVI